MQEEEEVEEVEEVVRLLEANCPGQSSLVEDQLLTFLRHYGTSRPVDCI
jgi:hypothetical protein